MKAQLTNDKWFTTDENAFCRNTDGKNRTEIDKDEARAAFDFEIEKHQSYTEDGRPIPKHWHLLRTDDSGIIPSRGLGDEYRPIQHLSVYDYIVNDIMPQVPGMKLENVGTMHGGGTGIISATVGNDFSLPGDESKHEMRLFFCNPCNGKGSLTLGWTTVRLFCQNQVAAAIRQASKNGFHIAHTTNSEVYCENALDTIRTQFLLARNLRDREDRLARTKVSPENLVHLVNRLFPLSKFEEGSLGYVRMDNQRNEVIRQFESGETAKTFTEDNGWKLFNSITYPIFNPKSVGKETDIPQIRFSGTIGSRASKVGRIFKAVEEELGLKAA